MARFADSRTSFMPSPMLPPIPGITIIAGNSISLYFARLFCQLMDCFLDFLRGIGRENINPKSKEAHNGVFVANDTNLRHTLLSPFL